MPGQMARPNMGQPEAQQAYQRLQHQMQASPLPNQQPQPQQGAMGMANNMQPQNMSQAQPQFQMTMQQQQSQQQQPQPAMNNRPQGAQAQFTPAEQAMILEMTNRYMAAASGEEKNNIRMNMQGRMDQATLLRYQAQGIDPLVLYYRNQVVSRLRQEKQRQLNNQQAGQGMPTNRPQSAVPMQQQQSGNPTAVGGQTQEAQQQMLGNADFGFLGGVDPSHQNANLGQETGQMGIPQNAQQGNTTPQPIAGLPAQGVTPNNQRVAQNPNVRAQQQFNAQQVQQERINQAASAQAQVQARVKAQQLGLHGQPGGMGPMPPAQSPAMNTLNAPLVRAPQQNPGAENQQLNQPGQQFGHPIDPRFAAAMNQRIEGNGQNAGIMFPAGMTQEQRQKVAALPADKLNEVIGKWNERVVPPGQQVRQPGGPMPGNGQMVRPNQGMPQAGMKQQNVANQMGAQFMQNGQPVQRPNQQMMAGMNPQQQMLIQQQMANRMSQQQAQGRNMPQTPMGDFTQIDHMEFPAPAVQNIPRQIPPDIKRWGQLKTWVAQNFGNMPQLLEQVKQVQRMHYQGLVRARMTQQQQRLQQQAAANRNMNQAGGQPQMQGGVNPAMGAPVAQMGQPQPQQNPQMAQNMANAAAVTMQDIQNARAHPSGRLAGLSDEEIRETLVKNQLLTRQRQQLAKIQQQQQMHQGLMPQATGQTGPMAAAQRPTGAQQPQPQQGHAAQGQKVARPQSGQPAVQPARPPQAQPSADLKQPTPAQARAAKAKQPASSPPQPQQAKNLKRASSDDVVEVPNPNAQQAARQTQQQQANQQQKPGQPQPPRFNLTAEQVAALTPDQRRQYIQSMQRFQQSKPQVGPLPTPEDMTRFHSIRQEELSKFKASDDLPMEPGTRQAVANKLVNTAPKLSNVSKVAPRWFTITHDEDRLRVFFRTVSFSLYFLYTEP